MGIGWQVCWSFVGAQDPTYTLSPVCCYCHLPSVHGSQDYWLILNFDELVICLKPRRREAWTKHIHRLQLPVTPSHTNIWRLHLANLYSIETLRRPLQLFYTWLEPLGYWMLRCLPTYVRRQRRQTWPPPTDIAWSTNLGYAIHWQTLSLTNWPWCFTPAI